MLRCAFFLLLFLVPSLAHAQIVLTDKTVTQEEVDAAAKKLQQLRMAQKNDALMEVGTFDILKREDTIKGDLLLQFTDFANQTVTYGSTPILVIHDEPANVAVRIHMRRAGDTIAKLHEFPPQPAPWQWVEAVVDGSVTLSALASSDAGKKPVVVSNRKIIIGKGPQPPPIIVPPVVVDPPVTKYTGLRVALVYEKDDMLTREQSMILASPKIRAWLDANCVKGKNNQPSWRKWDQNVVITKEADPAMAKLWEDAKPKLGPLPQLVIVTDQKGVSIPLPETEQATLAELAKYGAK